MFPLIPEAMAQSVAGSLTESPLFGMIPFVLIFVVFYFLLIRPQQKKQKALQQMIQNLQKGDKVITSGGIHGTIFKMGESVLTLEVAEKVRIQVDRQQVARVVEK
jgi:preprotein translocase subunit YajC